MWKGKGFGKVILFGEHFVVYGAPGIVAGLDKGIEVYVDRAEKDSVEGEWGNASTEKVLEIVKERLGAEGHYNVRVEEEVPSGAGLGASAAFAVALTKAMAEAEGKELNEDEVFSISYEAEKVFHGNPSGIDNAAATYGGVLEFVRGQKPKQFSLGKELHLLITYTGKKGSTKDLVAGVAALKERHPSVFNNLLNSYVSLYQEAREALASGKLERVGELMNINQGFLSSVGVSSKEIEEIVYTARENGAYGSKLTGAGGGGCVISLVDNRERADEIAAALRYKSFYARVERC